MTNPKLCPLVTMHQKAPAKLPCLQHHCAWWSGTTCTIPALSRHLTDLLFIMSELSVSVDAYLEAIDIHAQPPPTDEPSPSPRDNPDLPPRDSDNQLDPDPLAP